MLVGNPEDRAARILEAVVEVVAGRAISALRRRAPRAADQATKRAVRRPVDREHDYLETVGELELAADYELEPGRSRGAVGANHARDRAFVRQREPRVAELGGGGHELLRMRRAAQEREVAETMKLRVLHVGSSRSRRGHRLYFRSAEQAVQIPT